MNFKTELELDVLSIILTRAITMIGGTFKEVKILNIFIVKRPIFVLFGAFISKIEIEMTIYLCKI